MLIVRHPETAIPFKEKTDTPPDTHGKAQAIKVANFFKGKPVKQLFASPTKRSRYQADAISKVSGTPVKEDDRLKPWNVKATSEKDYNAKLDHLTSHPDEKSDEGESFNDFHARVKSFHDEHSGENGTVAVTHSKNIMVHRALALKDDSKVGSAERNKIRDVRVSSVNAKSFKPELVIKNSAESEASDA